jgi:hypothetical protein
VNIHMNVLEKVAIPRSTNDRMVDPVVVLVRINIDTGNWRRVQLPIPCTDRGTMLQWCVPVGRMSMLQGGNSCNVVLW